MSFKMPVSVLPKIGGEIPGMILFVLGILAVVALTKAKAPKEKI
jgi:hypothetical protein